MTGTLTTTTTVMTMYSKHLTKIAQDVLYPELFLYQLGDKVPLPGNSGKHIFIPKRIRKRTVIGATEGTPFGPSASSGHYYSGLVSGFVGGFKYSDFVIAINEIPGWLAQDARNLGVDMAQKYESHILSKISGGLSDSVVMPNNTVAANAVKSATSLTLYGIFAAATGIRSANARPYPDGMFAGVFHPNQMFDLYLNTSGATNIVNFATAMVNTDAKAGALERGTVGGVGGVRLMQSTNSAKFWYGTGATSAKTGVSEIACAFLGLVLAPGAYACVDLEGNKPRIIMKPFGSGGATGDPADQIMSQTIKGYFTAVAMDLANRGRIVPSGKTL